MRKLAAAVALAAIQINSLSAETALATVARIKRLTQEDARRAHPVKLRGLITRIVPEWSGFTLQDDTGGIYVGTGAVPEATLQTGRTVEVEGVTAVGNFAPSVNATRVRMLSAAPDFPGARKIRARDLISGSCDNTYVEVEGVVHAARIVEPPAWEWHALALRLDLGGTFLWSYVREAGAFDESTLTDATVRVRGVCQVMSNGRGQAQGSSLAVSRASDVVIVERGPADPFSLPLEAPRTFFTYRPQSSLTHRVHTEGIATMQNAGGIFMQNGADGIRVRAADAPAVRPGDRIEAVGFPTPGNFSTILDDAVVRVNGHGPPPAPREMRAGAVLDRTAHAPAAPGAVLLRVQGRVLEAVRSAEEESLILQDGTTTFRARLLSRPGSRQLRRQAGSTVEATGVCSIDSGALGTPRSFDLLMRSPADLRQIARAPFSRDAALRFAGALFGVLAAAAVWLALLRGRVRKQTQVIRQQFERAAALEQRYSDLVENASDLVYVRDTEGRLLQMNRGAEELTGYSRAELLTMNVLDLVEPADREQARQELTSAAPTEWRFLTRDGRQRVFETKQRFLEEVGQAVRVECIGRDITARRREQDEAMSERRRLEEQLQHAQKMESVGQLAGGVAHDFNNLLTVITGYSQMLLAGMPPGSSHREPVEEIAHAASRAAALTRQLLMFSRRQMAAPKVVSLNDLLRNLEKMLRRLIGEDIELTLRLEQSAGAILADPGHIEQVVVNLVVNARDAMPGGGRLRIETGKSRLLSNTNPEDLPAGEYVKLKVIDTGSGMSPEVCARIFEPFFTTKEVGKGTGLGLSTVYGIVKQTGGAISVRSEPGKGSEFRVLFPPTAGAPVSDPAVKLAGETERAAHTILLAEDEDGVRRFIGDVLRSKGYTVLEAANGVQAVSVAESYRGPIHLLLSDAIMPELGGVDLADRFARLRPGAAVLLMSGYLDRKLRGPLANALLEKPFTPADLLKRVREQLAAI